MVENTRKQLFSTFSRVFPKKRVHLTFYDDRLEFQLDILSFSQVFLVFSEIRENGRFTDHPWLNSEKTAVFDDSGCFRLFYLFNVSPYILTKNSRKTTKNSYFS